MGDEVSFDPVGDVVVHIGHLDEQRDFWLFGAANNVNHVSHMPGLVFVLDDHGHSRFDVLKDRIWLGWRGNRPRMANAHMPLGRLVVFKAHPVR